MAEEVSKREKYRQTRELIRIAQEDGMTQEEIARACRVQQSVVSNWAHGKGKAYGDQIKPLVARYGARLQRTSSKIYLLETTPAPSLRWEETEIGQRLHRLCVLQRPLIEDLSARIGGIQRNSQEVRGRYSLQVTNLQKELEPPEVISPPETETPHSVVAAAVRRVGSRKAANKPRTVFDRLLRAFLGARVSVMFPVDEEAEWSEHQLGELRTLEELLSTDPLLCQRHEAVDLKSMLGELCRLEFEERKLTNELHKQESEINLECRQIAEILGMNGSDLAALVSRFQIDFFDHNAPLRMAQVEGPIIFRYVFYAHETRISARYIELQPIPVYRWLLHRLADGRLLLVRQRRRQLIGSRLSSWERQLARDERDLLSTSRDNLIKVPVLAHPWVNSSDDSARWISSISEPLSYHEFLDRVDRFVQDPGEPHSGHDEVTLPFLARKALLENGYDVPEVVRLGGM